MNDLILADRELEVGFIGQLDALLEGIERMDASHKASPSNEQFLTDKEVSAWLKVSRRTLQDYRNNGMVSYQGIRHREAADERLSERLSSGNVNLNVQKQRKPMSDNSLVAIGFLCVMLYPLQLTRIPWAGYGQRKEQIYRLFTACCVQPFHDELSESHCLAASQPERHGNHHFKAVHVIANPVVQPDMSHRFLFRQFIVFVNDSNSLTNMERSVS